MIARLLIVLTLGAIVFVPVGESKPLPAPTGMHGFLLRADESFQRTFSRTPSFAWEPYEGASSYDAQLAMSSKFDDRTLVWSTDSMAGGLRVPAVAIPVALVLIVLAIGGVLQGAARDRPTEAEGVLFWVSLFLLPLLVLSLVTLIAIRLGRRFKRIR